MAYPTLTSGAAIATVEATTLFFFVVAMAFATLALVAGADASAFVGTDANFDREVMNSGKHVFVKYLAPW